MIISITDPSQVGEARRKAGDFARSAGMKETRTGQFALAVTELATNVLKHGGGGQIALERFDDADGAGIDCLALDRGQGMADVERCMRDGYSTAGTPGNGLGAVLRQADLLRIYSRPGRGAAVLARFLTGPAGSGGIHIGSVTMPYPGEILSGDAWLSRPYRRGVTLLVVDGSGHGSEAHLAASKAIDILEGGQSQECVRLMELMHMTLRPTRGAAAALVRVLPETGMVNFVGVGNIAAVLVTGGEGKHMVSHNGIVGYTAPRIRQFDYPVQGRVVVILHSDGISTRWKLADYPDLAAQHPALIAGVLMRDHQRGRDDATVVAMTIDLLSVPATEAQ